MTALTESSLTRKRRPTVAAIIPVYNGADQVAHAIQSALAQTVEPDEVIVVDDGSTDQTAEVVRRFPVKLLQQPNAGPAAARNAGARHSQSEWLAFLDHDDAWHTGKTHQQLPYGEDERVGVIYSSHSPRNDVALCWRSLWDRNIVGTPSGAMVRRECFVEMGGFDERRSLIGTEDHHLWLRIALSRWRFAYCPGRCYDYTPAAGSLSRHFGRMAAAEKLSYTEIAGLAGLDRSALRQKIADVNNHYLREFIGVRDLRSARELIGQMRIHDVSPELLLAAFSPAWVFGIRRFLRSRLPPQRSPA